MAKDPVCGMMVDEKIAKHVSRVSAQKILFLLSRMQGALRERPETLRNVVMINLYLGDAS